MKSIYKPLLVLAGLIAASLTVYSYWWQTNEVVFVGNLLQGVALGYCAIQFNILALNAIGHRRTWRAWAGVGAGVSCWFIAQLLEAYQEFFLAKGAYGTVADWFWGLGAVIYLTGSILLLREIRARDRAFRFSAGSSASLLLIAGAYVAVFFMGILPHLLDPSRNFVLKILDFAYPTIDFATAFCYCLVYFLARAQKNEHLATGALLVCLAFVAFSFTDLAWAYFRDADSFLYRLQDLAFFIGYCVNGIAAIPFGLSDALGGKEQAA